jgi:ribosomal protein S18 acetylase RimI-like enzyme
VPDTRVNDLVPFVHVADIDRSLAFYGALGFAVCDAFPPAGPPDWVSLESRQARLMLARASEPVDPGAQAVLFYLYAPHLDGLRDHLIELGHEPGPIVDGTPGPEREMRVTDPDGYSLMVAQVDDERVRVVDRRAAKPDQIAIRPATSGDEDELRALDRRAWSPMMSPAPPPPSDRPFFAEGLDPGDVLVAWVGHALAGYVQLGRPTPLEANRHVVEIRGFVVDPGIRRRGIGRALVEAAAWEATARGARRLTLRVLAPNSEARALYASCGFEEEGVRREEFLLEGRYVDDILMARDLSAD